MEYAREMSSGLAQRSLEGGAMRSAPKPSPQNPFEERCGEHSEYVGQEVPRVEAASKRQLPHRRAPQCVQRGSMIELTHLDGKADRQRREAAITNRGGGNENSDPPSDHR